MGYVGKNYLKARIYYALARRVFTQSSYFTEIRRKAYFAWWSAAAEKLGAEISDVGQGYYRISKGGRSTILGGHYLNIDTYLNLMLVGSKPFVQNLLQDNGYPVPRYTEYDTSNLDKALAFLDTVGGRCVVKPSSGSGGFGVTTGVNSRKRLREATIVSGAASYRWKPMIEEEIEGDSYRLLFLDGKLIDAVRRSRPTVIGDGKSTIRQLIDHENRQRLGAGPCRAFSYLTADLDSKFFLEDSGLTVRHVPAAGEIVPVKSVANQNSARDNVTVRDEVHLYFHELGARLSRVLDAKLIGIDVMATDLARPLDASGGAVNEINIPPGLHYHELIANPENKADVCAQILDYMLSGAMLGIAIAENPPQSRHLDSRGEASMPYDRVGT